MANHPWTPKLPRKSWHRITRSLLILEGVTTTTRSEPNLDVVTLNSKGRQQEQEGSSDKLITTYKICVLNSKGKGYLKTCLCRHRGKRRYTSNRFASWHKKEMHDQHCALATVPQGRTRYPSYRRLVGPQGWSGQHGKSRPHWHPIPGLSSPQQITVLLTALSWPHS